MSQSAGTIKVNSIKWDEDVIVISGYKWLGGYRGVAISVLSENMIDFNLHSVGCMNSADASAMNSKLLKLHLEPIVTLNQPSHTY